MNEEKYINPDREFLFEEFKAEWPEMFQDVRCGFYLPPAWKHIVWSLCEMIDWTTQRNKLNGIEMRPVIVDQVKSKFGGLRFYYSGGDDVIGYYVEATEALSHKICGRCGITDKNKISHDHSLNCIHTL